MANGDGENGDENVALLVKLLKLGSFINLPMKEGVCDPADLGVTECKVLMALAGEGALAGHDLVGIMGLPPMNVSRAIAALKTRGWIEDIQDPDNRRRRPVALTKAGWGAYATMDQGVAGLARDLLGNLSARQKRQFAEVSEIIIENMAEWITGHHSEIRLKH
jgi:DNA-binding MarR family transcriptional regulator